MDWRHKPVAACSTVYDGQHMPSERVSRKPVSRASRTASPGDDIAQDAVTAAGGLGAPLQRLCGKHDASALISIERPAVLARIGNKPAPRRNWFRTVIFLQALSLGREQASRQRFEKGLACEGANQEKAVARQLSSRFIPLYRSPLSSGFLRLRVTQLTYFPRIADSRGFHNLWRTLSAAIALFLCVQKVKANSIWTEFLVLCALNPSDIFTPGDGPGL